MLTLFFRLAYSFYCTYLICNGYSCRCLSIYLSLSLLSFSFCLSMNKSTTNLSNSNNHHSNTESDNDEDEEEKKQHSTTNTIVEVSMTTKAPFMLHMDMFVKSMFSLMPHLLKSLVTNGVVCPFSVLKMLALLRYASGKKSQVNNEIKTELMFPESEAEQHEFFSRFVQKYESSKHRSGCALLGTSMWLDDDILDHFDRFVSSKYYTRTFFSPVSEEAVGSWSKTVTHNIINISDLPLQQKDGSIHLFSVGVITVRPSVSFLPIQSTKRLRFGDYPLLTNRGHSWECYREHDLLDMIHIPSDDEDICMTLLLPNHVSFSSPSSADPSPSSLPSAFSSSSSSPSPSHKQLQNIRTWVVRHLTEENWSKWNASTTAEELTLVVPAFRLEQQVDVRRMLRGMNLQTTFHERLADFSRFTSLKHAFVSNMVSRVAVSFGETHPILEFSPMFMESKSASTLSASSSSSSSSLSPPSSSKRLSKRLTSLGVRTLEFTRPFVCVVHEQITGMFLAVGIVGDKEHDDTHMTLSSTSSPPPSSLSGTFSIPSSPSFAFSRTSTSSLSTSRTHPHHHLSPHNEKDNPAKHQPSQHNSIIDTILPLPLPLTTQIQTMNDRTDSFHNNNNNNKTQKHSWNCCC